MTQNAPRNCDSCPCAYECGILTSALMVIEAIPPTACAPELVEPASRLRQRLLDAGFGYPDGSQACSLVDQRRHIVEITAEAIDILRELHRSTLRESP